MIRYFLFVLLSMIQLNTYSQSLFQHLARNVGLLTYANSGGTFTGTGTMIFKALDGRPDFGYIFIVTNKHVLPTFKESNHVEFYVAEADSSSKSSYSKLILPIFKADGSYSNHVKVSTDEDLAIIEISSFITKTPIAKIPSIPLENFATKDILRKKLYTIGDVVFFLGFPNSFYSGKDYSPIFRTGYISTDPLKKYYFSPTLKRVFKRDSLNGFLIDGSVFGGSSGSLVFTYPTLLDPEFYKPGHALTAGGKANAWILGVLTESYYTTSTGEYNQRINIGGVISSEKVVELINSYTYRDKPKSN